MRPGGWRHLWALEGAGAGSGNPRLQRQGLTGRRVQGRGGRGQGRLAGGTHTTWGPNGCEVKESPSSLSK